jgi:hypothetical protein
LNQKLRAYETQAMKPHRVVLIKADPRMLT